MHLMLDIKTLSRRPDAAPVQISAVLFDDERVYTNSGFRRNVRFDEPLAGHVDSNLEKVFMTGVGSPHVESSLENQVGLWQALQDFSRYPAIAVDIAWSDIDGVWSLGAAVDQTIIANAYSRLDLEVPFKASQSRCLRTLFALTGGVPVVSASGYNLSDSLDSCILQARLAQMAQASLKKSRPRKKSR